MNATTTTDLHLVPEILLKRRHDLDTLHAKAVASSLTRGAPRKNAKVGKRVVKKIIKPETIVLNARSRKNGTVRFNRVSKKGMQKRASNVSRMSVKVWDGNKDEEVIVDDDDNGMKKNTTTTTKKIKATTTKTTTDEGMMDEDDDDDNGNKTATATTTTTTTSNLCEIPYKVNSIGATTVFAILLRPVTHATPKTVRRTLSALRLRRVNEGVFLPYTTDDGSDVRKMLHLVEPYVLYGIPSAETISDLVRRRGFGKVDGKRVALADNNIIEQSELGETLGLICVEDIIHVLTTPPTTEGDEKVGQGGGTTVFGKVTKFLWPFRLTARKSKFQRRMLDLKDGKLYGDQGEAMNGYIREML